MNHDRVLVLDLGTSKAAALVATMDGAKLKVEASASTPLRGLKRGVVTDLEETARGIRTVLSEVRSAIEGEPQAVVSISGGHLEGISTQGLKLLIPSGRQITHQDVLEVITHSKPVFIPPDRDQIQSLPKEFRVDGVRNVRRPIGMTGSKLEVLSYVVTGQTQALQATDKAVTMAGIKVEQMVLGSLAAGIGVLTEEELSLGTVVIDFGAGTTDVGIFQNGSLVESFCLPLGSGHITSDLVNLLHMSPDAAEKLKVEKGSALAKLVGEGESVDVVQLGSDQPRPMQRRVMCEIIEARVLEIGRLVGQHLEKTGLLSTLPGGIVLTGGGSKLLGIDQNLSEQISNIRVRLSEPSLPGVRSGSGWAVALGMARFTLQCAEDIAPASGNGNWKDRIRSLFGFGG